MTRPLPEVLEFMQVLWRIVHGLEQRSKKMAALSGVTSPQRLVIRMVGLYPGISATDLATLLHVHPSTVTGVLRRLGRQGLLARRVHPDDGRRAVLTLTADGGASIACAKELRKRRSATLFCGCRDEIATARVGRWT